MLRRWKTLLTVGLLGLVLLAGGLHFSGFFEPSIDTAFRAKLAEATPEEIDPLIAKGAEHLGVTALSLFVIEGDGPGKASHFGRSEKGALMQAASLSKAVGAAVILMLAEREEVGLDEDIRPQITSIDIAALEGGDRAVTLRQLLSHTTGSSQSGYPGYPRGDTIPGTATVIAAPTRFFESPVAFDGEPGKFRYSGGGYTIAQLWAEDVSGQNFTDLAEEILLTPLGMEKSTFAQPIEEADAISDPIVGADAGFTPVQAIFSALEDSWHNYPEKAAAGLWTTPEDYARFVSALLDAAAGKTDAIPAQVAQEMVSPQAETGWETDIGPKHYGFGVMLKIDGARQVQTVSHTGANAGYRAIFYARPSSGIREQKVVVVMGNTASAAQLNAAIAQTLIEQ